MLSSCAVERRHHFDSKVRRASLCITSCWPLMREHGTCPAPHATRCFGNQIFARSHGSLLKDFPQPDPYGRVGQKPRAALLSGARPSRHAATPRPHPAHPSVHMAPAQPTSAHRPQPCAHGVGRVTWSGAGMREPHHPSPSRDGSQKGGPVARPSLTLTPPSAGSSAFSTRAADLQGRAAVRVWGCDLFV